MPVYRSYIIGIQMTLKRTQKGKHGRPSKIPTRFQSETNRDDKIKLDFDSVLEDIGEFGWTQRLHFLIMCYISWGRGIIMISVLFLSKTPDFQCRDRPVGDPCLQNPPCQKFVYDTPDNFTSIVTEWNLVCESKEYVGLIQSCGMFGLLLGNLFVAPLVDTYGRWRIMTFSNLLMIISHTATSFSRTYTQFMITRLAMGIGLGGALSSSVWIIENAHSDWRSLLSLLHNCSNSVAAVLLAVLAYFFRDWRDLTLYSSFGMVPYIVLCWSIPESPRWLLSTGRINEAVNILMDIGRKNGVHVTRDKIKLSLEQISLKSSGVTVKNSNIIDAFRTPIMRKRMLILLWTWAICVMVYYSLTIGTTNLGGNMYVNVAVSGLLEIPTTFAIAYLCKRFGCKSSLNSCTFLCGIACIAVSLLPRQTGGEMTQYQTVCAMAGKICISSSFSLMYVYTGELLPTVIRGRAFGVCSTAGRIGGIIGPLFSSVGDTFCYLIFGSMCLATCLLCLGLPETLNAPLPDTIEDVETESEERNEKKKSL